MSKFKVGDLITNKQIIVQIIDVNEPYYTIKVITGPHQGKITSMAQHWLDSDCVKYDLDDISTTQKPLFDLSEEQIEEIKKFKKARKIIY